MKILILNWRDSKNPSSGGAEALTHEMAKRWARLGHEVTQFSSYFKEAKEKELVDGVRFIREGNPDARYFFHSVHFMAFLYYQKYLKGKFDVVVDEIHGLPFLTPLYVKEKKVVLICEVAGAIWDTNFPFPFNKIGRFIESNYFRLYKNIPFLTISPSTRKDLIKFGVPSKNIVVLPMGITKPKNLPRFSKETSPTLIFVGRLLKAKGIEDAIRVCSALKREFPNIRLWVVGRGEEDYENKIKRLIRDLNLEKNIILWGFVNESKKFELMQRAHVLVALSIKEGYGLTVPEAGIVGTPTVAYNVEGLRDIVKNGKNGLLVDCNLDIMAGGVKRLLLRKSLYKTLQEGALSYAKNLDWDKTAKVAFESFKNKQI